MFISQAGGKVKIFGAIEALEPLTKVSHSSGPQTVEPGNDRFDCIVFGFGVYRTRKAALRPPLF